MKKLNLCSGEDYRQGYVNADLYAKKCDVRCHFDKYTYPFKSDTFDYIISRHSLEHLKNVPKTLDECNRILKKVRLWK